MRILIFFLMILIVKSSNAIEVNEDVTAIAFKNYNLSIADLNSVEERCTQSNNKLPSDFFKKDNISKTEKLIVLEYFYYDSVLECSKIALGKYLINATALTSIAPKFTDVVEKSNRLIISMQLSYLRAKFNYDKLINNKKLAVVKPEKPFDLFGSAQLLNLN